MQAVIMVAGKSTRTYPLTLTRPKPLLPVINRSMIYYNLDQLVGMVDEVILIVGYRKEMIRDILGDEYRGLKLIHLEQKEQLGTGHAVLQTKSYIKDRFIVLNGDDLFARQDMEMLAKNHYAVLVMEVDDPSQYGIVEKDEDDYLRNFVEKPKTPISNLTNVGCYVMEPDIFPVLENLKPSERGEIELPAAVFNISKKRDVKVVTLNGYWLPTGFPWDLLKIQNYFYRNKWQGGNEGIIEDGAIIDATVQVGKGSVIKRGAHIAGPVSIGQNSVVQSRAYVGPYTTIGSGVNVGLNCYCSASIVMNNSRIGANSVIGHSVIGENVYIGENCHFISSLPNKEHIKSVVKGKDVDTRLTQFGIAVADNVKIGAHTIVTPGCKIWPDKIIPIVSKIESDVID